ncbi:MAG: DUF4870 domain-containing protein [Planctomycetes bacterium]|nr:DUF4870 domain-containing protein [Planctomycetota bacterium]
MTDSPPPAAEQPFESTPRPEKPLEVKAEPFDAKREAGQRVYDAPPPKGVPPPPPGAGSTYAAPPPPPVPGRGPSAGWSVFAHLGTLVDFCIPWMLIAWVPPLIIWLAKKNDDAEVEYHAREALNFQLNVIFWALAAFPLICALGLGLVIIAALPFVKLVLVLIASIRAADGQRFRYPMILRVV